MSVLHTARLAYTAGLCVLPVAGDGSKRPGVSNWKPFQTTRPTAEVMRALVQSLVRARHEVSA